MVLWRPFAAKRQAPQAQVVPEAHKIYDADGRQPGETPGSDDGEHDQEGRDVEESIAEEQDSDEGEDDQATYADWISEAVSEAEEDPQEEDIADQWEQFEANLKAFHPKLQDTRNMVAEAALHTAVRSRRNPTIDFNSSFVMGRRPVASMGARAVPPVVGVTGHNTRGGNMGVNGIYELYPGFCDERPIYQKMLEKRPVADLRDAPLGGLLADRMPRRTTEQRILSERHCSKFVLRNPPPPPGLSTMWPTPNIWFLFFDRGLGCWCIGPEVGHREVYAMCPGVEELIPDALDRWQVWDVGKREWYNHHSMKTFKASK